MPVTYFKVKPESVLYKNYFIEDSASSLQMKFLGMPLKNWFGRTAVTAPLSCTMTPSSAFGRLSGT